MDPKKEFMQAAIDEAVKADGKDYAIGAVIVKDNQILVKKGNRVIQDQDPTHHAEILAIKEAAKLLGSRHLEGCVLYTTHEPCPMCASAAIWAKIDGIVCGAKIEDFVEHKSKMNSELFIWRSIIIPASQILEKGDPKPFIIEEFMREECKKLFHE